ncbi:MULTISPECIES: pentapeptide repeat-containing protein [unclassified Chamaesiphon]|uniref:pentapeptide repeat-containing protein n=1 Tax=unclassified Chamaesiphon TaxID=2620921 RepID=UPI00286B2719|nr:MULTISPECIES: pentapeptide repeat-containing protein [unclassified Chamaesiphon]
MSNTSPLNILQRGVAEWNLWREQQFKFAPDLRGVDLSDRYLSRIDFRNANLSGANLSNTYLNRANLSGANLSNANLRNVNLSHSYLNGANLSKVDLSRSQLEDTKLTHSKLIYANLTETKLDNADFSHTNLTNANLNSTQALGTNFTSAIFTGACLENWNINKYTNLDKIICNYVYLKNNQQKRYPIDGNFEAGCFARFFQQTVETLDLIFSDGIDWKSFSIVFQKINTSLKSKATGGKNQLDVCAIEKRSDGNFVIRLNIFKTLDRAEIEAKFQILYEKQLKIQIEEYRQQLQFNDSDVQHYFQQSANLSNIVHVLQQVLPNS